MSNITFITFFTEGVYEGIAKKYIIPSFKQFSLPYKVYKVPDLNNWGKNTKYKARIILEALNEFNDNIVFVDADGEIKQFPELFYKIPNQFNLAVHFLDWFLHWKSIPNKGRKQLATGTMWFNNNQSTKNMVREWIREDSLSNKLEQQILQDLLKERNEINIYDMPVEYCVIPNYQNIVPNYIKKPVVFHNQVSRKYKSCVSRQLTFNKSTRIGQIEK